MTLLNEILQLYLENAVVEEYDEGIWHVRKYANGQAECYGTQSINWGTGVAWMGGYQHKQIGTTDFPTGLFVSPPLLDSFAVDDVLRAFVGAVTTKDGTSIYVLDGLSGGSLKAYKQGFIAKGKWK